MDNRAQNVGMLTNILRHALRDVFDEAMNGQRRLHPNLMYTYGRGFPASYHVGANNGGHRWGGMPARGGYNPWGGHHSGRYGNHSTCTDCASLNDLEWPCRYPFEPLSIFPISTRDTF